MADTRWLSTDEQVIWRHYLNGSRLLSAALERDLHTAAELPLTYYEILVHLSESAERTLRMSELAERINASRSRLSHAVARMEESGWIERRRCPTDGRGAFAILTDEGFSVLEQTAPSHVNSVRQHLFDPLSDDQLTALGEIFQVLTEHQRRLGQDVASGSASN